VFRTVVPVGGAIIAAIGEFIYPVIGRTTEPHLGSFIVGLFSVAASASSVHVALRNLKERL
jgi:hypothetical protein